jgi:hypothetical protein
MIELAAGAAAVGILGGLCWWVKRARERVWDEAWHAAWQAAYQRGRLDEAARQRLANTRKSRRPVEAEGYRQLTEEELNDNITVLDVARMAKETGGAAGVVKWSKQN